MKKLVIRHNNLALKVHLSKNCTTIFDSYKVKDFIDMNSILCSIEEQASPNMAIHKRSNLCMIREWRTHNLFHALGIKRKRTKDVDLNLNQPWYIKALYYIISPFYFHFI